MTPEQAAAAQCIHFITEHTCAFNVIEAVAVIRKIQRHFDLPEDMLFVAKRIRRSPMTIETMQNRA